MHRAAEQVCPETRPDVFTSRIHALAFLVTTLAAAIVVTGRTVCGGSSVFEEVVFICVVWSLFGGVCKSSRITF